MPNIAARYKQFPALINTLPTPTPENQQILRNLKELYDNHSKNWDKGTRYAIIDHVLNRETDVTARIARSPHRHRLMQRDMTFAIWIILRATYGLDKLVRSQYRFVEKYPGVDPATLVSPLVKKTKTGPLEEKDEDGEEPDVSHLRAPSIFGPVEISKFAYAQPINSRKRKEFDAANYQPWKVPKTTIKREEDTAQFLNALRPTVYPRTSHLLAEQNYNTASIACDAPLPSIESPDGLSDSESDNLQVQKDKENRTPPLRPSFHSPAQVSHSSHSMVSENTGTNSSSSSSSLQIKPLVEQCRKFDVRIRELQADINEMRKERQQERQSFINTIRSIRDEIRADMAHSRESTRDNTLKKAAKVDIALTEFNNASHILRVSLDALAVGMEGKNDQDKPSVDLKKTVDDLKNAMGAIGTYFESQQQEFRGKIKAVDGKMV